MFERLSEHARSAIVLAQGAARSLGHREIYPEHLLAGLAAKDESMIRTSFACQVLASLNITYSQVLAALEEVRGSSATPSPAYLSFTIESKQILESSVTQARQLDREDVGTEALLLALAMAAEAEPDTIVSHIIRGHLEVEPAAIKQAVLSRLVPIGQAHDTRLCNVLFGASPARAVAVTTEVHDAMRRLCQRESQDRRPAKADISTLAGFFRRAFPELPA